MSVLARLLAEPHRFSLDAALRILLARRPGGAVRFRSAAGVDFACAEVVAAGIAGPDARAELTVTLIGLTGPSGTLPPHISEAVVANGRARSPELGAFLDMLAQRMVAAFGEAGVKYQPHRDADRAALAPADGRGAARDGEAGRFADVLLALSGQLLPGLPERLPTGAAPFRHYAGLFAARPRSADRLQALASDWLARPVTVRQFAGAWLAIPPGERTRLPEGLSPGAFHRLGEDAAIGVRAWDQQARIVLRIGPLDAASFASLLPNRTTLPRLVALVRAYLGFETGFAVNLVLRHADIPPLALTSGKAGASGEAAAPRLGWNTWLPAAPGPALRPDVSDALFEAEIIEAEAERQAAMAERRAA